MVKHVLLAVAAAASLLGTGGTANAAYQRCPLVCEEVCDGTATSTQACMLCISGYQYGIPYKYCPFGGGLTNPA